MNVKDDISRVNDRRSNLLLTRIRTDSNNAFRSPQKLIFYSKKKQRRNIPDVYNRATDMSESTINFHGYRNNF